MEPLPTNTRYRARRGGGGRRLALWSIALAGLVLGAGCGGTPAEEPGGDDSENPRLRAPVSAIEVAPRDLSRQLSLSATVQPRVAVRLAARTSGTVREVRVEAGDRVEEGQLMAQLDTDEQQAEMTRARASAAEARAAYERAGLMRQRQLLSEADYEAAQARLAVSEGDEQLWRTRVEFGRILAPANATVTARHIEPGEAVDAQQVLFEMADLDELVLHLGVSELDVVHLSVGDPIPVRFDALPGVELESTVRRVFPTADADSRLVTVEVQLPSDAWRGGVRPGFLARVATTIDRRSGVLALPSSAIGDDDGSRYVFVIIEDTLERRLVVTGPSRGEWTEVTEGLQTGELVLGSNPIDMREGQLVRVTRRLGEA